MSELNLRYIRQDGREFTINSPSEFLEAVRIGHIAPETMVFDPEKGSWTRAMATKAYRVIAGLVQDDSPSSAGASPIPSQMDAKVEDHTPMLGSKKDSSSRHPEVHQVVKWVIAACVSLQLYNAFQQTSSTPEMMGYVTGTIGMTALILWVVWKVSGRHRNTALATIALILGFSAWNTIRSNRALKSDILSTLSTVSEMDSPPGQQSNLADDSGPVTRIVAGGMERSKRAWATYAAANEMVGEGWFTTDALVSAGGRQRMRANVTTLRAAASALGDSLRTLQADLKRQLASVVTDNPSYAAMQAPFDSSAAVTMAHVDRFLAAERSLFDLFDELIQFAASESPQINSEGTLLFTTDRAVSRYNGLINALRVAARQEEAALTTLQNREADLIHRADSVRMALR